MSGIHRFVVWVARAVAILGGIVLGTLILMVCLSIIGRSLNSVLHALVDWGIMSGVAQALLDSGVGAIRGDFELVEAGMAFCIFAFLPFCQVTSGHASVDILAGALPRGVNRFLIFAAEVLFAIALIVIAMQLEQGLERKMKSGETTLLLQFPVWWSYAVSLVGAVAAAAAAGYMAVVRGIELVTGRVIVPNAVGADH